MKKTIAILSAFVLISLLSGCGNADSPVQTIPVIPPPQTGDSPQGTLSNIPQGTKSIRLTLRNLLTGIDVDSRLLAVNQTGSSNAPILTTSFPTLPAGTFQAIAVAYPDDAGAENAIATGAITTQVIAGQTASLNVPLALTLDKLSVSPATLALSPYSNQVRTASVVASLVDKQGMGLKYPLTWFSSHPEVATVTVSASNPATVVVTGVSEGTTTVTAIEPNSGKSSSVQVTVRITN